MTCIKQYAQLKSSIWKRSFIQRSCKVAVWRPDFSTDLHPFVNTTGAKLNKMLLGRGGVWKRVYMTRQEDKKQFFLRVLFTRTISYAALELYSCGCIFNKQIPRKRKEERWKKNGFWNSRWKAERKYTRRNKSIGLSVIGLRGHFLDELLREISFLIRFSAESTFINAAQSLALIFFFIGFTGESDVFILSLVIG